MAKIAVKILLIFIALTVLQIVVVPFISINSIEPNLLVLFVIYYSLSLKKTHSLLFGFFTGLLFDLASGGVLGVNAFALTVVAFIANENKHNFSENEIFTYKFIWLVFLASSASAFLINFLNGFTVGILYAIIFYGIFSGLYTMLFAVPLLFFAPEVKLNE